MERKTEIRFSMNQGLILGLIFILMQVILIVFDLTTEKWVGWLSFAVSIGLIYWSIRRYRDEENGGFLEYWKGVKVGFLTMLFASFLSAFFLYIYYQFIDLEAFELLAQNMEDQMLAQGYTDEQVEAMSSMNPVFSSPTLYSVVAFFGSLITGFIISLIVTIFLKKQGDPFSSDMAEIEQSA
jgi:hypothetical protein